MKFESELLAEGHDVMKPNNIENVEEFNSNENTNELKDIQDKKIEWI